MEVKARKVAASLKKKGLVELERGSHRHYRLMIDGKKTGVGTMMSRSVRDLGTPYLSTMAKELELSYAELLDLIDCPLTAEAFVALLNERGRLR